MEHINGIKAAVTIFIAALTALWGWFGWFVFVLAGCMLLDYLTGSAAAKKNGEWSSKVARDGLWHKASIIVSVLVSCILDIVVGMVINNIPSIQFPFEYSVLFGPLIVAWYILTELGSILENSGKLGGPQPAWFKKAISAIQSGVDGTGEKLSKSEKE